MHESRHRGPVDLWTCRPCVIWKINLQSSTEATDGGDPDHVQGFSQEAFFAECLAQLLHVGGCAMGLYRLGVFVTGFSRKRMLVELSSLLIFDA